MASRPSSGGDAEAPLLAASGSGNGAPTAAAPTTTVVGKALSSTADLAKHLPTGAVLAFEMLSPSFTADGACNAANRALTGCLIGGPAPRDERYQLTARDVLHGLLSFAVFLAVAMVDRNVVACFYPVESASTRQLLAAVPVAAGATGSFLFAMFPSTRRGIGFPVGSS